MGSSELHSYPCEVCGSLKTVGSYFVPEDGKTWYYYEHYSPEDCIKHLLSRIEALENAAQKDNYLR